MGYFDGLVGSAQTLLTQAAGLLETTKQFKSDMTHVRDELKNDFKEEDIKDNMGDVDFANDMAESLLESLTTVVKSCERVTADCIKRKDAMDRALAGLEDKEDELVEN